MSFCRQILVGAIGLIGASSLLAQPSAELIEALRDFRTEGPKGWSFTQTSHSPERSRVETFDPLKAAHLRWDLITEDGAPPPARVLEAYRQQQTRRTGGHNAPNVKDQLDMASAELLADDGERQRWRFLLTPGAADDSSAEHMESTITFHLATGTIIEIALASFEAFSPVFGVTVESARTTIQYSLPTATNPTLLQHIEVSIRGRAFYFKSLDSDMTVSYSDYEYAGKKPIFP